MKNFENINLFPPAIEKSLIYFLPSVPPRSGPRTLVPSTQYSPLILYILILHPHKT